MRPTDPDDVIMTEFRDYLETVINTGRLAKPTVLGPSMRDHAQALTQQLHQSFTERADVFSAYERYVDRARRLDVEVRDVQPEMQQVRAGLLKARPSATFSVDLMRESISMLERNAPVHEVIDRTIKLQMRAAAVEQSRVEADRVTERPVMRAALEPLQRREQDIDGPDQRRRR